MLYDPKWEVKTKADPMKLETLIAWLEQHHPGTRYIYGDVHNCLLAQYFRAHGYDVTSCGVYSFSYNERRPFLFFFSRNVYRKGHIPWELNQVASRGSVIGSTFGAALGRARKLAA